MRAHVIVALVPVLSFLWEMLWLGLYWMLLMAVTIRLARAPGVAATVKRGVRVVARRVADGFVADARGWSTYASRAIIVLVLAGIAFLADLWLTQMLLMPLDLAFNPKVRIGAGGVPLRVLYIFSILPPIAGVYTVWQALESAGREVLRDGSKPRRWNRLGGWRATRVPGPSPAAVDRKAAWPARHVHVLDRRVLVAQMTVLDTFSLFAGAAVLFSYFATNQAVVDFGMLHKPNMAAFFTLLLAELVVLYFVVAALLGGAFAYLSSASLQARILRCLARDPVEHWRSQAADPLGPHRAELDEIAHGLRKQARRIERGSKAAVPNPHAVILRGVARKIESFTGQIQSIDTCLPADLEDALTYTVAVLAGPRKNETRHMLAGLVDAFNAAGEPDPALVVPASGRVAPIASRVFAAVDRTSNFAKALFSIGVLFGILGLVILGRFSLTNIPTWSGKP